jgi:hypothetical protein
MSPDYSDSFGYEKNLPDDIREIFMWLCQDVAHIQFAWTFYIELFTSKDYEDVADLAAASFRVIEEAVRADITMSICRISDPAKNNLTFKTLARKCNDIHDINILVDEFLASCEPIRRIRHKKIGHNDLNTRIDPLNNPLPGVGQKEINEILTRAKQILNTVIVNYASVELYFDAIMPGSAKNLLYFLKLGKQYQEENRIRRFKRIS